MSTQSGTNTPVPAPPPPVKVALEGVAETLLISLAARSADAKSPTPVLGDQYAAEIVERLDYDSSKLNLPESDTASVALRGKLFDTWTASFLANNPNAIVLHVGCGLDSRVQRLDWGPGVSWIDVDLPDAIALRRQVLPTSYEGRDYRVIGADVREDTWLQDIPSDRPVVVVMEGFMSYLNPEEVKNLLARLIRHFKEGELLFDCINTLILSAGAKARPEAVLRTGADFQSAIDDVTELERTHQGLSLLETIRFVEAPGVEKLALKRRIQLYILSWIPVLRDSSRLLRCGFNSKSAV